MTTQASTKLMARAQSIRLGCGLTSLALLALVSFLTGCGGMVNDVSTASVAGAELQGNVHGGQNPVAGATVQLYTAASTGYGAAASPLGAAVQTTGAGNFTLGAYTCPGSPNDQVYIVASGGDSGSGTNANLALMAALGPCSNLSNSTFITINEVTTVASAYALSGFMSDYAHVGASGTNYTGLSNAFATVNNLVSVANGQALSSTPAYATSPAGTTAKTFASVVPQAEIYTLANIIASCVNTNGVGGSSTNCANLFASTATNTTTGAVGGTPDTIQAVLSIAKKPGVNVANIYNFNLPAAPFAPVLASAPNDWTIALNFIGGGLGGTAGTNDSGSTGLAIDASDNIWITNTRRSTITELTNLGAPVTPSTLITPSVVIGGISGGGLNSDSSIAADLATPENIWVGNGNGAVSEFTVGGIPVGGGFTGGGSAGPALGLAIDGVNNVWVTSPAGLAEFNSSGVPYAASPFTSDIDIPTGAIAVNGAESVFVANSGNGFLDKFNQSGTLTNNSGNILSNSGIYGAIDGTGQFWSPYTGGVLVFGSNAIWTGANYQTTSISNPTGISIDGADHVWIVSGGGAGGQAAVANVTELTITGSAISPSSTGYTGTPFSTTPTIVTPKGAGIDNSGNLWIVNGQVSSTVTEFVGVAAPTYAPLAAAVAANKIGQMP